MSRDSMIYVLTVLVREIKDLDDMSDAYERPVLTRESAFAQANAELVRLAWTGQLARTLESYEKPWYQR